MAYVRPSRGPYRQAESIMMREAISSGLEVDQQYTPYQNMTLDEAARWSEVMEAIEALEEENRALSAQLEKDSVTLPPGNRRRRFQG